MKMNGSMGTIRSNGRLPTKNDPPPALLTVHHLDGNKWNLLPWNLAALCQRCHHKVQWTLDFHQADLRGVYPDWLQPHVKAYNKWAQGKGRDILWSTGETE